MRLYERRNVRAGLLLVLMLLALVSLTKGLQNARGQSQDLQWSGARMLMRHIDPWRDALNQDPGHLIQKSQIPNYLPLLYILMLPLGILPLADAQMVWAICNILFAMVSVWLATRFFGLRRSTSLAVLFLLLIATPTRVTIGNGQYGLLVLLLWSAGLLIDRLNDGRSMVTGVSYVKFNFAPPVLVYLLMRFGIRRALVSLLPILAGAIVVCLWLGEWHTGAQLMQFLTSPLHVAEYGYFPRLGGSNLMDMVEPILDSLRVPFRWFDLIETSCAVLAFIPIFLSRPNGDRRDAVCADVALLALASFALFRHHPYDSVVLLFVVCYALRGPWSRRSIALLCVVAYFWYLQRGLDQLRFVPSWRPPAEFALLAGALAIMLSLRRSGTRAPSAGPSEQDHEHPLQSESGSAAALH